MVVWLTSVIKSLLLVAVFLWLAGCSSTAQKVANSQSALLTAKAPVDLSDSQSVYKALLAQFELWRGTQYRYGGTGLDGVDCSAYVQNTFTNRLGVVLPRTTRIQIKFGVPVDKTDLEVGDVLFFKVASNTLHNGVYLGNGEFMHASSSKGVTISSLANRYWQSTYLHARRYFD